MATFAEERWAASARREYAQRQADNYSGEWIEHHKRLREIHWGLADEHDRELTRLGYREPQEAA